MDFGSREKWPGPVSCTWEQRNAGIGRRASRGAWWGGLSGGAGGDEHEAEAEHEDEG